MQIAVLFACVALGVATNIGHGSKIIGGQEAGYNQFPYQAWLSIRTTIGAYLCGAVAIEKNWVLTAGHCTTLCTNLTYNPSNHFIDVYLGDHNREGLATDPENQYRVVKNVYCGSDVDNSIPALVFTHPEYNKNVLSHDIGLINVLDDIVETVGVGFIDLPPNIALDHNMTKGDIVTFSGWGKTADDEGTSDVLKFGQEPVISQEECLAQYPVIIGDGKFCTDATANPDGSATCSGDSGGPVTWLRPGCTVPELRGVVSFGSSEGCEEGAADGFGRVKLYEPFIYDTSGIAPITTVPTCGAR